MGNRQMGAQLARAVLRVVSVFAVLAIVWLQGTGVAQAQSYRFDQVVIEGNERIEPATILNYAGIGRGQVISAGVLNDAYQRLQGSGLFEEVELIPAGNTLRIRVQEYPTINIINFEGNARLKDEVLAELVQSQPRRVYSPATAEADANRIAEAYAESGRLAARVTPKVIRRDGNRVDLAFEIREGSVTEVERVSFTGNRAFSDRRLRQVIETKQAGVFRRIIQSDTYVAGRIDFDRQLLTDFYRSRGYIDAQVTGVASEMARERDGFFVTFNVREGQQFRFNNVTTVSEVTGVDVADFAPLAKIRSGTVYSPSAVDLAITRMEGLALRKGLNFVRVEPRITRNDRNQTLDLELALTRGPRVFVERIDIEGNTTTLDRVIRRQFRTVEGDPFNPREIRNASERIRALGFFSNAAVDARQGSSAEQVVVDVNVEEQPTGSLSFGASYGVSSGFGVNVAVSEANFLGRGQFVSVQIGTTSDNQQSSFTFVEPFFLSRDLRFRFSGYYNTSENDNSDYSTRLAGISPSIDFPVSENGRLELRYKLSKDKLYNVAEGSSEALKAEEGDLWSSALGYTYSYDTRTSGLNPNAGVLLRFGQDYVGAGGDVEAVVTSALVSAQTKVLQEEVTLRAELEGGAVHSLGDSSTRVIDRFSGARKIRGFEYNGLGPRDLGAVNEDALGGNYFAVARFEAEFPLGLPEEYGVAGGLFLDVGSVWGLDDLTKANAADLGGSDDLSWRSVIGFSLFWDTAIGPLRFNFSKALVKEDYDLEQNFDLTISTRF
ncbi:outer membrane protein assembly factor BamA [Phaeovulum sp. NW3]|uniref:outer membrane protein assembly factor BamA n=1 Tax=Phaeovulum sp. NW3 TaxID=2934933 RepID=UPI0020223081|nr:outer membrane protein assembly factor BamA [Phaeovulum sp. NW3]MCL7463914.1 outer membrane protein assembly factor BamA [Phaeovulum sp. NW3]